MDDLLDRLATDLDGAFDALLVAHQDRLHSIALRMTGDRHDAEEIAQDAFVRAYRALATYDAERIRALEVRAWLATIVVNLCRNRARRHRPATISIDGRAGTPGRDAEDGRELDLPADRSAEPEATAERRTGAEEWARLLLALPPRYREAIVLRHVDGLAYEEMATALRAPVGTLKARVHRGLALLRAAHDAARREEDAGVGRAAADGRPADPGVGGPGVGGPGVGGSPAEGPPIDGPGPLLVRPVPRQLRSEALR